MAEWITYENNHFKHFRSWAYNYTFSKLDGQFYRWGDTPMDDPLYSPFGPEIADVEISVNGCPDSCKWCYKSNTNQPPTNMSLDTFQALFAKLPPTLTQIAFGITGTQTNPDFIGILEHCHNKGIIPNYTLTGVDLTQEIVAATIQYCGAIAVSAYPGKLDRVIHTVEWFADAGAKQINVHLLYHRDNIPFAKTLLESVATDERLSKVHAVILLALKTRGKAAEHFRHATQEQFDNLVDYGMKLNVPLGMDSCSAHKFLSWCDKHNRREEFEVSVEPCESGLFSSYFNVHGEFFPCSFAEGEQNWQKGIDTLSCDDFVQDIWDSPRLQRWRNTLLTNQRNCPLYTL